MHLVPTVHNMSVDSNFGGVPPPQMLLVLVSMLVVNSIRLSQVVSSVVVIRALFFKPLVWPQ